MRIFNENKTQELNESEIDLEKGYLKQDKLFIAHHDAQDEVQEQSHEEVIAEYPNGGKDVITVIDVPYQAAAEAWDEYEDINVYIVYTADELENMKQIEYDELVNSKIRKKYSLSAELAILRQQNTKTAEYAEYNTYCEKCKAEAKTEVFK